MSFPPIRNLVGRATLSRQEERVLALSVSGMSDKEIAQEMGIAFDTVRTYWQRIRDKVGGGSRAEIVARVVREGAGVHLEAAKSENDRLQAEIAQRQEAEAFLRTVLNSSPYGIFITGPEGDCTYANTAYLRLVGREIDEVLGRGWVDAIHPEDRRRVFAEWYAATRGQSGYASEHRFCRPNGETRIALVRAARVLLPGIGTGYVGTAEDVTDLRASEASLRAYDQRLRSLVEAMPHAVWISDGSGEILFANGRYRTAFGDQRWCDVVHPDQREAAHATCLTAARHHAPFDFRALVRLGDESYHWVQVRAEPQFTPEGAPSGYIGTLTDVDQLVTVAAELEAAQERMGLMVDGSQEGLWDLDLTSRRMTCSPRWLEMIGLQPEEVPDVFAEWVDRLHPEDDARATERFAEFKRNGARRYYFEHRLRHRDGTYRWIEGRAVGVRDEEGRLLRMYGANLDVTERKELELRAVRSEGRFRAAIDSTINLFALLEPVRDEGGAAVDFRLTDVNRGGAAWFGGLPSDFVGKTLREIVSPTLFADYLAVFQNVLTTGETHEREIPSRISQVPAEWVNIRIARADDVLVVKARDVSQRRRAQEALAAQNALADEERRFSEAVLATSGALIIVADTEGRIVKFNHACEQATGWTFEELQGRLYWEVLIPPEEQAEVRRVIESLGPGCFPNEHENHWLTKSGERRRLQFRNTCLLDANLDVAHVIGIGIDVTERRAAEAEAQQTRELLERAQQLAQIGSWEADALTGDMVCSTEMLRLLGFAPGTVMTFERSLERVPLSDAINVRDSVRQCLATRQDVTFRHRVAHPGGDERVLETLCHPLADGRRLVGTTMDVTERDRWENQIQTAMMRTVEESVRLEIQQQELTELNEKLTQLATTDGLTGVANHRTFQERLEEAVSVAQRHGRPLSLVMLDVDHFKRFNDDFGHQAGDAVLRQVAQALTLVCRTGDLVARYGGEEFAVILREADAATALKVADRLRRSVEARAWQMRSVTASLGVATLRPGMGRETLIAAADRALYAAKASGRNRVEHADTDQGDKIEAVCEPRSSSSAPSRP